MEAACGKKQHIFLMTKKRYTALKWRKDNLEIKQSQEPM